MGVYGSIRPRYFRFGATARHTLDAVFHGSSTIGLCGEVSSFSSASDTRQYFLASSMSATITASGLKGRLFLRRRSCTDFSLVALQARRKPPRPLMAIIFPSLRSWLAAAITSVASTLFPLAAGNYKL